MSKTPMRRRAVPAGLSALAAVLLAACATAEAAPAGDRGKSGSRASQSLALGTVPEGAQTRRDETRELEKLYKKAVKAGGKLTVWAGGDSPVRQDALQAAFSERFPEIDIEIVVDLSKFHNLRIEDALDGERELPDVAQLQTTFDFDRWSEQDVLLPLKNKSLNNQKPGFAHPDGDYATAMLFSFRPTYATNKVSEAPESYADLLSPEYADGKLALTYPHDDDAVLYVYDKLRDMYGDEILEQIRDQDPEWIRGTAVPTFMVGDERTETLGNLTGGPVAGLSTAFIPANDEPFITWNQRGAVFKDSPNPAAGELYMAWVTSKEYQSTIAGWNVRNDLAAGGGLPELTDIPGTDAADFTEWMSDREEVAEIRNEMAEIFGPVQGESPLLDPELLAFLGVPADRVVAEPEPDEPIL